MSPPVADADRRGAFDRLVGWGLGTLHRWRRRWVWFDHLLRAGGRYNRMDGDLMAAGVTYFAFLSIFPVILLAVSILGLVLAGDPLRQGRLEAAILEAVPGDTGVFLVEQLHSAVASSGITGIIGALGFFYAGLRTMDKLRIGVRRVWTGRLVEADFLKDNLRDLVAFVALAGVGLLSVLLTGVATSETSRLLDLIGLDGLPGVGVLTTVIGVAVAIAADTVVFLWLLKVVAHTRARLRHLLLGALFGAVGFEVLKVLGSLYLSLLSGSVTASALGGAVGVLIWINVVSRFALFTAAWTTFLPAVEADREPPATRDA